MAERKRARAAPPAPGEPDQAPPFGYGVGLFDFDGREAAFAVPPCVPFDATFPVSVVGRRR